MIQGQQIAWKISLGLLLLNLISFLFLIEQLILPRKIIKKIIRLKNIYFLLLILFLGFFVSAYFQEKEFLMYPEQIIIGNELSILLQVYIFWGGIYLLLFVVNIFLLNRLEKIIKRKENE